MRQSRLKQVLPAAVTALAMAAPTMTVADETQMAQLIVAYNDNAEPFAGDLDYTELVDQRRNIEIIRVDETHVEGVKATLSSDHRVDYVERDAVMSNPTPQPPTPEDKLMQVMSFSDSDPSGPPVTEDGEALFNDPGFTEQHYWAHPDNEGREGSANIGEAFEVTEMVRPPRIAILDTGASLYDEGMDWSGGINLVSEESGQMESAHGQPLPPEWAVLPKYEDDGCDSRSARHGQHVGSIIGAPQNSQYGIAGVLPDAEFLAVRVKNCLGSGPTSDVVDGILWAAGEDPDRDGIEPLETPVDAINLSLGREESECTQTEQNAIDKANDAGVVVIAAAGNDDDVDPENHSPANCDGVITVTGATRTGDEASQLRGSTSLSTGPGTDLTAQGAQVMTEDDEFPEGRTINGTSFAAPIVTGITAMMRANVPGLTPHTIRHALMESARTPNLSDEAKEEGFTESDFGAGLVDAGQAFRAVTGLDPTDQPAEIRNPLTEAPCSSVGSAASQALDGAGKTPVEPREFVVHDVQSDFDYAVLFEVADASDSSEWQVSEATEVTRLDGKRVMVDVAPEDDYGVQFCNTGEQEGEWECQKEALIPLDAS